MLHYTTTSPSNGQYLVTYQTPGCDVLTVACECHTQEQADTEAARLNAEQKTREKCLQAERLACGLGGVYPDLEGA